MRSFVPRFLSGRKPLKQVYAYGFSKWKRKYLGKFLANYSIKHIKDVKRVRPGSDLYVWGNEVIDDLPDNVKLWRVEDGFVRSIGLGAKKAKPLSWVFDDLGMYYDCNRESRLEAVLNSAYLEVEEKRRASDLITDIVQSKVTKYNLDSGAWSAPQTSKKLVLVVGQVETDASIRYGSPNFKLNYEFVSAIRAELPEAYLIYKPHPDVLEGLRAGDMRSGDIADIVDAVVHELDPIKLIDAVDEVHVITSLLGFEALLRGKKVVCHGAPFYSGWGLTEDRCTVSRRRRLLTIEELVHGSLIAYPSYIDNLTNRETSIERTIDQLKK